MKKRQIPPTIEVSIGPLVDQGCEQVKLQIKLADNTDKFWWNLRKEIVKETRKRKPVSFDIDARDVSDVVKDYEEQALILFDSLKTNKPPVPNAQEWECKYCEYRGVFVSSPEFPHKSPPTPLFYVEIFIFFFLG